VFSRREDMRRRKKVIIESGTCPEKWTSYRKENWKLKAQSGLQLVVYNTWGRTGVEF
jgi:hypothetical protein